MSNWRFIVVALLLIQSALIVYPALYAVGQETGTAVDDDTVSKGYEVIKKARQNKGASDNEDVDAAAENSTVKSDSGETPQGESPPDSQKDRTDALSAKESPAYDSTGKRDPFKPFLKLAATSTAPAAVIRPPLQRYPLDQFRISGIVWIGSEPKAMVVDPEANTYFLGVGDKIGNQDGEILEVRDNGLLVQEKTRYENVYGEVKIEVKKSVLAFQNAER